MKINLGIADGKLKINLGIKELIRNNDFPKVFVFSFALFSEDRKYFLFLVLLVSMAQASQALAKVQHVRLCCDLAGFCCEGCDRLGSLVSVHRGASHAVVRPANTYMETRLKTDAIVC